MNLSSATFKSSSTRGCLSSSGSLSTLASQVRRASGPLAVVSGQAGRLPYECSIMLLQILFLVLLDVLFGAELAPAVVDLVAAGELVRAVGGAPDDVALVIRAEHGRARHDPDVHASLVLAVVLAGELQGHLRIRSIHRAGVD